MNYSTTKQIPLTQGKFALVDAEDYDRVSQFKWCAYQSKRTWYAARGVTIAPNKQRTQHLHRFIMGEPEGYVIDHIDGNGLNCVRINMRACTQTNNKSNRKKCSTNASGYKGVCYRKRDKIWVAQITVHRKSIYLGSFTDPIFAAKAYDAAAVRYFGEFAHLNFTPECL